MTMPADSPTDGKKASHSDVPGFTLIDDPVPSYHPSSTPAEEVRGLRVARQPLDLIQFAPGTTSGTAVRLRVGRR
jgi:hypothetical protein